MLKFLMQTCLIVLFVSSLAADIVFLSDRDGKSDIYVMKDDGDNVRRITDTPFTQGNLAWAPDGKKIVFATDLHSAVPGKLQQVEVYLMNADGSGEKNLTEHPALDVSPTWSPDGKHLAFTSSRSGNWEIHVMELATRKVWQVTHSRPGSHVGGPAWAPDGKKIAYELTRPEQGRHVYIMNADGSNARPLLRQPRRGPFGTGVVSSGFPTWSPDGEDIVYSETEYAAGRGTIANRVLVVNVHTRNLKTLDIPLNWRIGAVCWADGGSAVLFAAVPDGLDDLERRDFKIFRYRLGTGQITNLTEHPSHNWAMDWTPHKSLSVSARAKLATQWAQLKTGTSTNVKPPF